MSKSQSKISIDELRHHGTLHRVKPGLKPSTVEPARIFVNLSERTRFAPYMQKHVVLTYLARLAGLCDDALLVFTPTYLSDPSVCQYARSLLDEGAVLLYKEESLAEESLAEDALMEESLVEESRKGLISAFPSDRPSLDDSAGFAVFHGALLDEAALLVRYHVAATLAKRSLALGPVDGLSASQYASLIKAMSLGSVSFDPYAVASADAYLCDRIGSCSKRETTRPFHDMRCRMASRLAAFEVETRDFFSASLLPDVFSPGSDSGSDSGSASDLSASDPSDSDLSVFDEFYTLCSIWSSVMSREGEHVLSDDLLSPEGGLLEGDLLEEDALIGFFSRLYEEENVPAYLEAVSAGVPLQDVVA